MNQLDKSLTYTTKLTVVDYKDSLPIPIAAIIMSHHHHHEGGVIRAIINLLFCCCSGRRQTGNTIRFFSNSNSIRFTVFDQLFLLGISLNIQLRSFYFFSKCPKLNTTGHYHHSGHHRGHHGGHHRH